jgi:tetratricopeptide (TPR) repeat protein
VVRALRECLGDEPYTPLTHYCSPYHTSSPLQPVIGQLERAARLDRDEPPDAQLAKLEAVLASASDRLDEVLPLLAALLGMPTGERYPALNLTPEVQKRRTLYALVDQLAGLAMQQPVLALYEDVHWIDPSTLELLGLVVERIRQLPVLVLITFRPELQPPWTGQAHVTPLTMSRFRRRQGADLVARVTGDKPLPVEVVEQIVARTDGVPLFIEELTKTVLESGLLADAGDRYELSGPLPPLAIPTTLHDSLMARLDRLAPVKEVAQTAAVIGREFSHELLAAVTPLPEPELDTALDQLVQSELIFRHGMPPEATYTFKHALVQDAAYQSLLRSKRQQLHARIAKALNSHFGRIVEEQPELVARHYSAAGEKIQAFESWLKAGKAATRRSANKEALSHMTAAEKELGTVGNIERVTQDKRRLELLMSRAPVFVVLRGWSAPEVEADYEEALRIARSLGRNCPQLFDIWRGLYNVYVLQGDLTRAEEATGHLRDIALERNDKDLLLSWRRAIGLCDFLAGRFDAATKQMQEAMASFDPAKHPRHTFAQGSHPAVIAYSISAWAHWFCGNSEKAAEASSAAITAAKIAEHPFSLAYALCLAASLAQSQDKADEALSCSEWALALSTSHEYDYWRAWASIVKGWSVAALEDPAEGSKILRDGIAQYASTHANQMRSYGLCLLAETYSRMRCWREAIEAADSAIAESRESGIVFYEPEAHRLRGEGLCQTGKRFAGLRALLRAVRTAHRQRSGPMLLRASVSFLRSARRGRARRELKRDRLRAIIVSRAKRTLAKERTCPALMWPARGMHSSRQSRAPPTHRPCPTVEVTRIHAVPEEAGSIIRRE